jgi:hypothetical protein
VDFLWIWSGFLSIWGPLLSIWGRFGARFCRFGVDLGPASVDLRLLSISVDLGSIRVSVESVGLLWSRSGVDVCKLGSLLVDFCRSVSVDQVWSGYPGRFCELRGSECGVDLGWIWGPFFPSRSSFKAGFG